MNNKDIYDRVKAFFTSDKVFAGASVLIVPAVMAPTMMNGAASLASTDTVQYQNGWELLVGLISGEVSMTLALGPYMAFTALTVLVFPVAMYAGLLRRSKLQKQISKAA